MLGVIYLVMFLYAILSGSVLTLIYWVLTKRSGLNYVVVFFLLVSFSFCVFNVLDYHGVPIIR